MRNAVVTRAGVTRGQESGYTLIELAIVTIVVGLLLVPAIGLYSIYKANQRLERTTGALENSENALSGFRSLYGRYPCPAPENLGPGDVGYGMEECNPANPGITDTGAGVLIGSLPYRQLNMQEPDSLDGYGNRVSYAVTTVLTDPTTFSPNAGAITVLDATGNPVTAIAPFVVVTHNQNAGGAISRFGQPVQACPAAPDPESENCNGDATFRMASQGGTFDDRIVFTISRSIDEWRYSVVDDVDVELRDPNTDGFVIGAQQGADVSNAVELEVRENVADDATIKITKQGASGGRVLSQQVCDETGLYCFSPSLLGGNSAAGTGLMCPPGEYLVGIEGNSPRCEPEIWLSCPKDTYMAGIRSDGTLICNYEPPPPCGEKTVRGLCGQMRTIPGEPPTPHGNSQYVYSGMCYDIDGLDPGALASMMTAQEVIDYVESVNQGDRNERDCGPDPNDALVQDRYICNAGKWTNKTSDARERVSFYSWASHYWSGVENNRSYAPFSKYQNDDSHDCWCREDYRVDKLPCAEGLSGNEIRIMKYPCPQTGYHTWIPVWQRGFCGCQPHVDPTIIDCDEYLQVPPDKAEGISGKVKKLDHYECDANGDPYISETTYAQTENCECPDKVSPTDTWDSCPLGLTNAFTYYGKNYEDVQQLYYNRWKCPGGTPPQQATSAADAGYWTGPQPEYAEACVCDTNLTEEVPKDCPNGMMPVNLPAKYPAGKGMIYQKKWSCVLNDWEPEENWTLVNNYCAGCVWKIPTNGASDIVDQGVGGTVGNSCACGSPNGPCSEATAGGKFERWVGCTCGPH